MLNLPILERFDVFDYGLFPGPPQGDPGLHVTFGPGLTLVLGTNGLGKSTLVLMLYRLLTGPVEISGLIGRSDLGNVRLDPSPLPPAAKSTFAQRVTDNANIARARLECRLGDSRVVIERRLRDLALIGFSVNGEARELDEESVFQHEILNLVGVWSFGDWILLLRHLVFYFEDRRALVWDSSAQRQIFRLLFLPPTTARKWTEDERAILELDSRVRNLNAALTREERAMAKTETKAETVVHVREELKVLGGLQQIDTEQLERLEALSVELEAAREDARLRLLSAEQEKERRFRELERARLLAIGARFPNRSETARYILAQLLTDNECLVCGSTAPAATAEYNERINDKHCVICGTDLSAADSLVTAPELADTRVALAQESLAHIDKEMSSAQHVADEAAKQYDGHCREIGQLNAAIYQRSARIDSLVKQLPPAEAEMHEQRKELASLRTRVVQLKADLLSMRQLFRDFIQGISLDLVQRSQEIKSAFDQLAHGFLFEECQLVWAPRKARVGETGEAIDFPGFELEMTGTDFTSLVRRHGPDQVSESQREFIDLAFRMALMQVAGYKAAGTLVIDAPESSLDAVFTSRAAAVLARFALSSPDNRLIVTSNLIEGRLIPHLLAKALPPGTDRKERVIDLFESATPTAAVRELRDEYAAIRDRLLTEVG